ncbi:hypothetical protein [Spirosoma agri]|uniref:DUF4402 domain-containing protein n=1 Tax=Spirosoma agri TaxID=1987381 RepID=A0A6M0IBK8_9BACT|nr:hypothetical protein [Spirosoma agri]NEU65539.1 hypothetical protein [Spirosoma agri]
MLNSIKKGAVLAAIALCGLSANTHAQTNSLTPAVVTVTLVDILAVAVSTPAIPIVFATVADYQNGKTIPMPLHVIVSSNRPYDLKVKSAGDLTSALPNTPAIPINNVSVQVTTPGMNAAAAQALSTSDVTLTTSSPAAMARAIDVTYSTAAGNSAFVNTGVYTANLTYSVTAH